MLIDLGQTRTNLTKDQRCILDRIWVSYYRSNGNTWPAVQDIQIEFERPLVLTALEALPRGTVYEENEQYQIGPLGVLLTSAGIEIERHLVEYLNYVRLQKKNDLALRVIQSGDVATTLKLSDVETMMLGSALHLSRLAGDRATGGPVWAAGIPRELADLMRVSKTELGAFVRDRATRMAEDLAAARAPAPVPKNDFWFVAEPELRAQLEMDRHELLRVQTVNGLKSCVLLSGGILEGMLLDVLTREQDQARAAFKKIKGSSPGPLGGWDLVDLVAVGGELGIIPKSAMHLSDALREFRNLVHPGKQLREKVRLSEKEADLSVRIVDICIAAISAREEKKTTHQV